MNRAFLGLVVFLGCTLGAFGCSPTHDKAAQLATDSGPPAKLKPAREPHCQNDDCHEYDAIVFVHGIYGSESTFFNSATQFEWPKKFVAKGSNGNERSIDTYYLHYQNALLSWASKANPDFKEVAKSAYAAMKPLRQRKYRSIGFIAHSLGGNIVSTYMVMVTEGLGHPQRSLHAYTITLATPVLGAQIADLAGTMKSLLGMNDSLLNSLEQRNLYLEMLETFRELETGKGNRYGCRPVHLHAAIEEKYTGPILIVSPTSSADPITKIVASPIKSFPLNHSDMVKPKGLDDPVAKWVQGRVEVELNRLDGWGEFFGPNLCAGMPWKDE